MNYEQAKRKELEIIDKVRKDMERLGWENVEIDDYCRGDLILIKDGKYICYEVKFRTYDLAFFEQNGTSVEMSKLEELNHLYGVDYITLLTVTSDGWLLKSKITFNSLKSGYFARKTTCFNNRKRVFKTVYLDREFKKKKLIKKRCK